MGITKYYAADKLAEEFGREGKQNKPVCWHNIPDGIRNNLIDKHKELATSSCGYPDWSRLTNFLVRHIGCVHTPPDYYINYGYYYCTQFEELCTELLVSKGIVRWSKKCLCGYNDLRKRPWK